MDALEYLDMSSLGGMLWKVGLFILVQALVYLILSQSSAVFSKAPKSHNFKPARTLSIRRWAAALADIPAGGEPSPSPTKSFFRSFSFRSTDD